MANAIDCLLHVAGQTIWELKITASAAGDTLLDVPTQTKKKHRVYGIFRHGTRELFEHIGTETDGDAVVFVREQLDLTSQVEYRDIIYEITEEVFIEPLHTGTGYAYILHRYPRRTVTV